MSNRKSDEEIYEYLSSFKKVRLSHIGRDKVYLFSKKAEFDFEAIEYIPYTELLDEVRELFIRLKLEEKEIEHLKSEIVDCIITKWENKK